MDTSFAFGFSIVLNVIFGIAWVIARGDETIEREMGAQSRREADRWYAAYIDEKRKQKPQPTKKKGR